MITTTENFTINIDASARQYLHLEETVIFDIETTGFSPKNSIVYLIGVLFQKHEKWQLIQWLAESPADEAAVLISFKEFLSLFLSQSLCLVHFNGGSFDLPFLKKRCEVHGLPAFWESLANVDLYRRFRPLKKLLKLSSMNLKSLEDFLSVTRTDTLDGGELISVFYRFCESKPQDLKQLLLLHNRDDLLGTAALFPLFAYQQLLDGNYEISKAPAILKNGSTFELILHLSLAFPVPKPISVSLQQGYFTAGGASASLGIPGFQGTLKYFFDDYRSYYYLPLEDTAIHKSVAAYVDKEHRVPAKASTCYCKRTGLFLPGNAASAPPKFQQNYNDSQFYQECTEEFLQNNSSLHTYSLEILRTY